MGCPATEVNLTKSLFAPDSESGSHQESSTQHPIDSAPGVGLPPASLDSEKRLHLDSLIGLPTIDFILFFFLKDSGWSCTKMLENKPVIKRLCVLSHPLGSGDACFLAFLLVFL